MSAFYFAAAAFILATIALGLWRILQGPDVSDRLMASQLIGSGGVAILVLLAAAMSNTAVIDVALMLAILSVFASIGFVNWSGGLDKQAGPDRDA